MLRDPGFKLSWLSRTKKEAAFSDAFERYKKQGVFKGLKKLHRMWGLLSETGSHATLNAICDRFKIVHSADGGQAWQLSCCGTDEKTWAVSSSRCSWELLHNGANPFRGL